MKGIICHVFLEIDHGFTKTVQQSIKNIYRNIKAALFNLAPEMYITKEENNAHRAVAMTTVMLMEFLVSIKTGPVNKLN